MVQTEKARAKDKLKKAQTALETISQGEKELKDNLEKSISSEKGIIVAKFFV